VGILDDRCLLGQRARGLEVDRPHNVIHLGAEVRADPDAAVLENAHDRDRGAEKARGQRCDAIQRQVGIGVEVGGAEGIRIGRTNRRQQRRVDVFVPCALGDYKLA